MSRRRQRTGLMWSQRFSSLVMVTARVSISFFAASQVYLATGADLPIDTARWLDDSLQPFALLLYGLVYFTLYVSIFVMELYINDQPLREVFTTNIALIIVILVLPLPFAFISAELSSGFEQPSEVMSVVGLAVIVLGLHAISRSDYQTRRQLDEMTTLSIVTRSMRAHLDLDGLLKTIYVQISDLFDVADFTLVIYDDALRRVLISLVIRAGQQLPADTINNLADYPLIDHIATTRSSLYLKDNVRARAGERGLDVPQSVSYSWMGVPMVIEGDRFGVMAVGSNGPHRTFSPNDLRLLTIVADSASIAIENAQLFQRQSTRVAQLSTLNNIASLLSGTLSPDNVLDTIVSSASTISDAQAVALYLFDEDMLTLERTAGLTEAFNRTNFAPQILGQSGELFQQKPLAISNIRSDSTMPGPVRQALQSEGLEALVELPLALGDNRLGVLVLFFHDVQKFTDEWLELLRTYANQAAQAISNARTYAMTDEAFQRSVEQLLSLAGIGRMLTSTIDLKTICRLVLQHVMDATRADAGVVALAEDDRLDLMTYNTVEPDMLVDGSAIETGISQRAMRAAEVQRVDDVVREGFVDEPHLIGGTRSQLGVPILRGREPLGVITVESRRLAGFTSEDSYFVSQIANQAVIAIDNARLFERITEARDRLQVILDTMEEAILLIDNRGRIALANPRIQELLDLMPFDLLNRNVQEVLDDPDMKLAERMGFPDQLILRDLLGNLSDEWEEHEPHVYVITNTEGNVRYLQRFIIPVLDDAAQTMGALFVFYDKTDEQEISRTREELTRMIVHDLRSPLTAVMTSMKILRDYVPEENDVHNLVQSTTESGRQAVKKLLGRVDSLLDISKMQSGRLSIERRSIAFQTVFESVADELRPLSQELDIRISQEGAGKVPLLYVDHDKVERLLLNLLDNALKYSPTEDVVRVRSYAPGEAGAQAGYVRVDVIDNGPGVPDNYKESLFDSFVQVAGRPTVRRGVGLGLSFCKLVTEAHGGRIWVEDNSPTGSIFAFTLPVAPQALEPEDDSLVAQ